MPSSPDVNFDHIGQGVMEELNRRLGSPELAKELPGTLLMKVASDYVKHLEKRNELEQARQEQEKIDPIEVIDQPGMPIEMRVEILSEYLDEIELDWRKASERMEELLEEVRLSESDGEVVPEVQEVGASGDGV